MKKKFNNAVIIIFELIWMHLLYNLPLENFLKYIKY